MSYGLLLSVLLAPSSAGRFLLVLSQSPVLRAIVTSRLLKRAKLEESSGTCDGSFTCRGPWPDDPLEPEGERE